jgi:sugar phosphate isomerase/epimerase
VFDRSARRDLAVTCGRHGVEIAGIDFWIPPAHFLDPAHVDRAVAAVAETIGLAGDVGRGPVSLSLPVPADDAEADRLGAVLEFLADRAEVAGVILADHAFPAEGRERPESVGIGVDPAACLAAGHDPVLAVAGAGPALAAVRLVDLLTSGMRGPIGDPAAGQLDFDAYRLAVAMSGLARPVVVDLRQWVDPWGGLARAQSVWMGASDA